MALRFAPPASQRVASEAVWADRSCVVVWALAGQASAINLQAL